MGILIGIEMSNATPAINNPACARPSDRENGLVIVLILIEFAAL
jgi:hypothetical protein